LLEVVEASGRRWGVSVGDIGLSLLQDVAPANVALLSAWCLVVPVGPDSEAWLSRSGTLLVRGRDGTELGTYVHGPLEFAGSSIRSGVSTRDGRYLATASDNGSAAIWEPRAGRLHAHLRRPVLGGATLAAMSSDGRCLVSVCRRGYMDQADVHDLATMRRTPWDPGWSRGLPAGLVAGPGGRWVVAFSPAVPSSLTVTDAVGQELGHVRLPFEPTAVGALGKGNVILTGDASGWLRLWSLAGDQLAAIHVQDFHPVAFAGQPGGPGWAALGAGGGIIVGSFENGLLSLRHVFRVDPGHGVMLAMSRDGEELLLATRDEGIVRLACDGSRQIRWRVPTRGLRAMAFVDEDRRALLVHHHAVEFLDCVTGEMGDKAWPNGHADRVVSCAFVDDDRMLVTASSEERMLAWRIVDGTLIGPLPHPPGIVTALAHAGGSRIAGVTDKGIYFEMGVSEGEASLVWRGRQGCGPRCGALGFRLDVATGVAHPSLPKVHRHALSGLLLHPRQPWALVWQQDEGRVWVLDRDSGELLAALQAGTAGIVACALSPDGSVLATADQEGTLAAWTAMAGPGQLALGLACP